MIFESSLILVLAIVCYYVVYIDPSALCFENKHVAMDGVELHYFHSRGRAEAARLMLAFSDVKFKDVRYTRDEWLKVKKSGMFPFFQMPMLVDQQRHIAQSQAIVRHIARMTGLDGKNESEVTTADELAGFVEDMRQAYAKFAYNSSAPAMQKTFVADSLMPYFEILEKRLVNNGGFYGGGAHFVGNSYTYADVMLFDVCDNYCRLVDEKALLREHFPSLMNFLEKFATSTPSLRAYLASPQRPPNVNGKMAFIDNNGAK